MDQEEEVELNSLRRDSVKLYDATMEDEEENEGVRRGEVPVIMLGETGIPMGGRWDDRETGTGEEGEGAEKAGVILGSVFLPLHLAPPN